MVDMLLANPVLAIIIVAIILIVAKVFKFGRKLFVFIVIAGLAYIFINFAGTL